MSERIQGSYRPVKGMYLSLKESKILLGEGGSLENAKGQKLGKCSSVVKSTRRKFGLKQDRLKGPKMNGLK